MAEEKLELSKIKLGGKIYYVKDAAAREAISAGLKYVVVSALPTAAIATMGKIYLVKDESHNPSDKDIYDEYITIDSEETPKTYSWEKLGNTDVNLEDYAKKSHTHKVTTNVEVGGHEFTPTASAQASAVSFADHSKDNVLGEGTSFTNAASTVSFEAHTTDNVLGEGTTFTNAASAVSFEGQSSSKMVKGSVLGVKDNEESILGVKDTEESILGVKDDEEGINEYNPSTGFAMVAAKMDESTECLELESLSATAHSFAKKKEAAQSFAKKKDAAQSFAKKNDEASSFATGALAENGAGDAVITAVGTGTAAAQVISVGANDKVASITALGAATAAAQTITVGSEDKVSAIIGLGAATAAAQQITVDKVTLNHDVTNNEVCTGASVDAE